MTWEPALADALRRHGVPGASLSVYDGSETIECAAGVLNLRTGLAATTDSLFLVGSITKPFTATLVLGLVAEGRIALEDRVLELLPELRFAPGIDPRPMTVEHLLCHSCGVESDNFADFGRGDDALVRFVASLAQLELVHAPGARFSYSNSGYSILGRIVEVVLGTTYAAALRERVLDPLGMRRATTFAEEAILYPVAIGHYDGPDGTVPGTVWTTSRACEPEGMLCAPSGEILRLAIDYLAADRGRAGSLLGTGAAQTMRERGVPVPAGAYPPLTHQGLGWGRFASEGRGVVGHNGSIMGQSGCLRIDLDRGTAVTLLTNCDLLQALAVYDDLLDAGLREVIGEPAQRDDAAPAAPLSPREAERLPGTYRRLNSTMDIRLEDDRLLLTVQDYGGLLDEHNGVNPIKDRPLAPLGDGIFRAAGTGPLVLAEPDAEHALDYIYFRGRLARRSS